LGRIDLVGALLAMVVGELVLLEEALLEGVVVFDAVVSVLEVLLEPVVDGLVAAVVLEPVADLSTPELFAAAGYCGFEPVGAGVFDWVVVDCA